MNEKRGLHKAVRVMLRTIQHICFTCIAVCCFVLIIGTGVRIEGLHGNDYYNLLSYDSGNAFEDTVLTPIPYLVKTFRISYVMPPSRTNWKQMESMTRKNQ